MIFSKGKARNMRIDKKKTDATGELSFMSGCNGMLPTMFDVQPVAKKDRIHQSELPLSLCEQILHFVTYEGEVVLEFILYYSKQKRRMAPTHQCHLVSQYIC